MSKLAIKVFPLGAVVLLLLLLACTQATTTSEPTPTPTASPAFATPTPTATASPSPTTPSAPTPTPGPGVTPSTPTPIPSPTNTPTHISLSEAFDEALARVIESLPGLRELEFQKEVLPQAMTRQQLADFLREELITKDREQLEILGELYLILGLMEPGTDLVELYLGLLGEQVLGLFDTETEDLYVVTDSDSPGVLEEITLAHEYVHALQQQHFDIHGLGERIEGNRDAETALSALIEGDATLAELFYALDQFTLTELQRAFSQDFPSSVLDSAPNIVQRDLEFPYLDGYEFAQALFDWGSWEAVNDAFLEPPASTEQVLHPELYLQNHEPQTVTLPSFRALPDLGWQTIDENTMGEFFLRVFLDEELSSQVAFDAAAGWGGDRYVLFGHPDGRRALALLIRWDTADDATEFGQAIGLYVTRAYGPETVVHFNQANSQVLIVIASDQETVDILVGEFASPS